jgi:hypothetical protein
VATSLLASGPKFNIREDISMGLRETKSTVVVITSAKRVAESLASLLHTNPTMLMEKMKISPIEYST